MWRTDHTNLTVFHFRWRLFGPGRFDAGVIDRSLRFVGGVAQAHAADRLRLVPCPEKCRNASAPRDAGVREAWPFDTAFPSGLPRVVLFPGQVLSDMPSAGAQLAKVKQSDNKLLISTQQPLQRNGRGVADQVGRLLDVLA